MGEICPPIRTGQNQWIPELNVVGTSGFVAGTTLIFDGSISGWNPPIIEETLYRKKVLVLRNDKKALIRYDIDKEGPHVHYDKNGYKIKVHIPESNRISLQDFILKVQEFKEDGNGIINSLRKKIENR